MKNLAYKLASATAMSSFFVGNAFAQGSNIFTGAQGQVAATAGGTLGGNLTTLINYFLGMLGLVAVAFLIYAGVLMVTAGGAEEQVTKARKIIMYAAVGIVIILLSYTIVTFVSSALG
jgi:cytochrome bd-type quinol oxidase subunit 2